MKCVIIALACIFSCGAMQAQLPNREAFLLLNLDCPGLKQVKSEYEDVIRYISVLHPFGKDGKAVAMAAKYKSSSENQMEIEVEVDGRKKVLKYQF